MCFQSGCGHESGINAEGYVCNMMTKSVELKGGWPRLIWKT